MNKPTILVVGVNGFVGKHLARELRRTGHRVIGTGIDSALDPEIQSEVSSYTQCDMTVPKEILKLSLEEIDGVINLAGLAAVGESEGQADLYNKVNVYAHTNLIDRLLAMGKKMRVLSISTGAVYDSNQRMPITEEAGKLARDGSPYVMSKLLLEERLRTYRGKGLEIIIIRPFNHTGPGQGAHFILPDLARSALEHNEIVVGPVNTSRDYTDVRDVVTAYRMLITHPTPLVHTIYNVCSGVPTSRDALIKELRKATHKPDLSIRVDSSLTRINDPLILYGSNERLVQETGWQRTKQCSDTVSDYVAWLKTV